MFTESKLDKNEEVGPQRKGKMERKFQTFYGRIRRMVNDSGIDDEI
jgi:hypothetical protein